MFCILCGKEYARDVTLAHIKSHGLSRDEYDQKKSQLSEAAWNFYWSHDGFDKIFPDPLATEAAEGKLTFRQWCKHPKVQNKHEELRDNG